MDCTETAGVTPSVKTAKKEKTKKKQKHQLQGFFPLIDSMKKSIDWKIWCYDLI